MMDKLKSLLNRKSTSDSWINNNTQGDFNNSSIFTMKKDSSMIDDLISLQTSATTNDPQEPTTRFLIKCCLRPNYSLRLQLMSSFGSVTILSILFVMLVAIIPSIESGTFVKKLARENLEDWALINACSTSKYMAETWTGKLHAIQGVPALIRETTMDRFMGYPAPDDTHVPFVDTSTGRPGYPLRATSKLPLDWQYEQNVNQLNHEEHLMSRFSLYPDGHVGTASAVIRMQGACDLFARSPNDKGYSTNCTEHHNNIEQGGAIAPTEVFSTIHTKASDYATAVLKPMYEYMHSVHHLGIYFANDGAGASVVYPAFPTDGRGNHTTAHGCDWMREANPLDPVRPIGTEEQIVNCHAANSKVPNREYNPMEQTWCKEQAQNPDSFLTFGPYHDALHPDLLVLSFGKAVYDRVTKNFIGCTLVDISIAHIQRMMLGMKKASSSFNIALVRWEKDGKIVASNTEDFVTTRVMNVAELNGMAVTTELFEKMKQSFEDVWGEQYKKEEYDTSFALENHFLSSYPVPVPPAEYDPNYRPEFLLILSISKEKILQPVDALDDEVQSRILDSIRCTIISGFTGIFCVLFIVYAVSVYLTKPMHWMNKVGERIVISVGSHEQDEIDYDSSSWLHFSPKTEISALVVEFQKMVKKFSGSGTARLYRQREIEIRNPFDLVNNFASLYENRKEKAIRVSQTAHPNDFSLSRTQRTQSTSQFSMGMPWRKHWGPNVQFSDESTDNSLDLEESRLRDADRKPMKSALYWWIFCSIAIPLLASMGAIVVFVQLKITACLPGVVSEVEKTFINLNLDTLDSTAEMRAIYASAVISSFLRDLHVYFRITGWLLFGALERSESFTKMTSLTEHCKDQPENNCSYDKSLTTCDCKWGDQWNVECEHYDYDTRTQQYQWYITSNEDTLPNGDRNSTSYPKLANSPMTTSWVHNVNEVPGAEKGGKAAGYHTTYDRFRAGSAASMISIPVLNYDTGTRLKGSTGVYSAFEQDGTFMGYSGCEHFHLVAAFFLSDKRTTSCNATDFCPHGKYGFDPRCRDWYTTARKKALEAGTEDDLLHVTPPFIYGSTGDEAFVSSTAAMSWVDPKTNEYIGQGIVDIDTTAIVRKLNQEQTPLGESGFHVLVATRGDQFATDTIVGPGFTLGTNFSSIKDLLLPHDTCDEEIEKFDDQTTPCQNLKFFDAKVLQKMRGGHSNQTKFWRHTTPERDVEELVHISYAQIDLLSLRPVDSSNIKSGVKSFTSHPLSLAVGVTRPGLLSAFASLEGRLTRILEISFLVISVLMLIAFFVVMYITTKVVSSIITPVAQLLELVQKINKCEIHDDIPIVRGGSSEVSKVRETFERLYMVMRFANSAFFAGDLLKAYDTLKEALKLFTKLKNSKAIGVANNNLGNTMLTMYRAMKSTGSPRMYGMTRGNVVEKGVVYFKAAINFGELAIAKINEEEGWSNNYLVYMQQLSNRYFNRGIFLLNVKNDHPNPEKAEQQGLLDLSTAKDMDCEVVDNGEQQGFKGDKDVYFDLLLSRIKGLLQLLDMGYQDEWGLMELFDNARKELTTALTKDNHILFTEMLPAAQMQRLDAALIDYYRLSEEKCPLKAAEVAIRMMVEDEYVMNEAASKAIKALIEYTDQVTADDLGGQDPSNVKAALYRLRNHFRETMAQKQDVHDLVSKEMFRQSNVGDFFMEEW